MASGPLLKLRLRITNMFSQERQKITASKQDITQDQIVQSMNPGTGTIDNSKSQNVMEEALRFLQNYAGVQSLADNTLGGFKRSISIHLTEQN